MKKILFFIFIIINTQSCLAQALAQYGFWEDEYYVREPGQEPQRRLQTPIINSGSRPYIQPEEPDIIQWNNDEEIGTVIISTKQKKLYYVISNELAYRYPISVGREGFSWSGVEKISRIQEWPEWIPPREMLDRRPDLPERMSGGIDNPLGAVAMYLGNTLYRIHGTNDPNSIGRAESSGCFRMLNEHAIHLSKLVKIGTIVKIV